MRRLRTLSPIAVWLLTLLLFLQWGAAMGHCLRALGAAAGTTIEICGAEGLRTVHVAPESEADRAPVSSHQTCPACPGSVVPEARPSIAVPTRLTYVVPEARPRAGLPPSQPRAPPQQPRAPPVS